MRLNVYAIDDSPRELYAITDKIQRTPGLTLLGCSCDSQMALKEIMENKNAIDLLLLDIEMPGLDGISVGREVSKTNISIVLVSGHNNYGSEAFGINAVDYIMKPLTYDRFLLSLFKVWEHKRLHDNRYQGTTNDFLFVPGDGRNSIVKVFLYDMLYIEAEHNYSTIFTFTNKILTHSTIREFDSQLSWRDFMRSHRSYLVNLIHIKETKNMEIIMDNGSVIPISENYKKAVWERLRR